MFLLLSTWKLENSWKFFLIFSILFKYDTLIYVQEKSIFLEKYLFS